MVEKAVLFAAPHRFLFLTGAVQFAAIMAWWSSALLELLGFAPALPQALPASLLHAPIMVFLVLPPFFFGFLLTVFPRWIGYPDTQATVYLPVGLAFGVAALLLWLGLAGVYSTRMILTAFALAGIGWAAALVYLFGLLAREQKDGKPVTWHGWSAAIAMTLGLACLTAAALGLLKLDAMLVHSANLTGLWLFVLPVFVTVCHRMVPFFAGNVVAGYVRWRPFSILAAYWAASLVAAGGYAMGAFPVAAAGNLALAVITGLMLWKWTPRQSAPGLLWVLVLGFAWAPAGYAMAAWADLFAPQYGRGAIHLLTVGFAASIALAMVTRVTQGHSGRPLAMNGVAWAAFVAAQAATILRLFAALGGEDLPLLALSAACLTIGLLPWVIRSAFIYATPRADGKPG